MDFTDFALVPDGSYEVIYADPPWLYYGDPNKDGAAGKEYKMMSPEEISALPVRSKMRKKSIVFLWATCPMLDVAIDVVRAWGLHFRGVPFVWVKTKQDGSPIGAQGVRPSIVKPLVEVVIAASTIPRGRPIKILDESIRQTVFEGEDEDFITDPIFASRGHHSEKPHEVRARIERLFGPVPRLEMFDRGAPKGEWDRFGDELTGPETTVLDLMSGA